MRDILPAQARLKLSILKDAATEAADARTAALNRMSTVRGQLGDVSAAIARVRNAMELLHEDKPKTSDKAELEALTERQAAYELELSRQTALRGKHDHRHSQLSQLLTGLNSFLARNSSQSFDAARVKVLKLKDETLVEAVNRLRSEIRDLKAEQSKVRSAPPPRSELKVRAREYVEALYERGCPKLVTANGRFDLAFLDRSKGDSRFADSMRALVAFQAWLAPNQLYERLCEQIDETPEAEGAMTVEAKATRQADLEARLESLEREEEQLIERASEDGQEILRRPDASPTAVLGIIIRVKETQAA